MSVKTWLGGRWAQQRAKKMERVRRKGLELQKQTFLQLVVKAQHTVFGKEHHFSDIHSYADFQQAVPLRNYEQSRPWLDRVYHAEADITWPGKPLYLAKTSGTTSGAKYIPITRESIRQQIAGARDTLLMYMAETKKKKFLDGKMMFLSGSPEIEQNEYGVKTGRLSGIVNHFVPGYLQSNKVPGYDTNTIEDWEEKVATIVKEVKGEDLRLISGIPPWVQMLFEELDRQTGKGPLEVWPNLQLFVQGGVDFQPYKPIFDQYFGGSVDITEVYPASEGFFAFQDSQQSPGLLLMPDYGIFYEFIPLEEYGQANARRLTMESVELNQQYAMIISTNAGLWAYDIGDTVKFVSLNPYRIRVTGRVKHFISAFGEHVISEEVNSAMMAASTANGAEFYEFTVAPRVVEERGESSHEWLIEFTRFPDDMKRFTQALDRELRKQNSYYEDLRKGNILTLPLIRPLARNACRNYMKSIGKLGGQNKFPRLSNDRKIADALYPFLIEHSS